jgi:hypothetical protein
MCPNLACPDWHVPDLAVLCGAGFTEEGPDSHAAMEHAYKWILKWGGGLAFVLIVAWPCLALPAKVFSKGYFTFWVILSIVWGLVSPLHPLIIFILLEHAVPAKRGKVHLQTCTP